MGSAFPRSGWEITTAGDPAKFLRLNAPAAHAVLMRLGQEAASFAAPVLERLIELKGAKADSSHTVALEAAVSAAKAAIPEPSPEAVAAHGGDADAAAASILVEQALAAARAKLKG